MADQKNRVENENSINNPGFWDRFSYSGLFFIGSLFFLVIILYSQTAGYDFVNWDDPWYVVNNSLVKSWHPENLYKIGTEIVTRNYAPVTIFSYLVDHSVWGLWPGGYHLTNYLLHAVNAILIYLLLYRLTGSKFSSWAVAAIWAVHPVNLESVVWISARKGLLSGAFILAALNLWVIPKRTSKQEGWAILFFALALFSKAIAVVIPAIIILYEVQIHKEKWSKAIAGKIIPCFMSIMLLLITMMAQNTQLGGIREHYEFSKLKILAIDSVIIWEYVQMLLFPGELSVMYDPETTGITGAVIVSVLALGLVGYTLYRLRHKYSYMTWAVCSFIILLVPILNLFPITTLMNDRYLYLPSIPFWAVIVFGMRYILKFMFQKSPAVSRGLIVVAVFFAVDFYQGKTQKHMPVWKNGLSLWTATIKQVPDLPVVQIQLANTYHSLGQDRKALSILHRTINSERLDEADRKRVQEKMRAWKAVRISSLK